MRAYYFYYVLYNKLIFIFDKPRCMIREPERFTKKEGFRYTHLGITENW